MGELTRQKSTSGMSFLTAGSGTPFVLLHGIPGSAYAWAAVGQRLAARYQVVIPDLLGFGRSDLPAGDYYMEDQARTIKQLLDELGIRRLHLAGHDFGGPVALTLLRLFPEMVIDGLVLSATNVFTDTYVPPPLRLARVPGVNTLFFKAMIGNRWGARLMYLAAVRQKGTATWNDFQRHLTPSGLDLTRCIFQRSLRDLKGNYQAVEATLGQVTAPTLVLWGARDPFFGVRVGERVQRVIPGATLNIYNHTGHFVPEERPHEVANDILGCFG